MGHYNLFPLLGVELLVVQETVSDLFLSHLVQQDLQQLDELVVEVPSSESLRCTLRLYLGHGAIK